MAIYQADVQVSIPEPFGFDDRYYWTWVCYYNEDSDIHAIARIANDANNITVGSTTHTVRYQGYRITSPPRSGNVIDENLTITQLGIRTTGELIPIENVMKVRMWSAGQLVGWRYWRGGFLKTDIEGMYWNETVRAHIEASQRVALATGQACSLHGLQLDNITVDREVRMLNLRHGTKRRARKVLT